VADWAVHLDAPQQLTLGQRHWLQTARVPIGSIRIVQPDDQYPAAERRGVPCSCAVNAQHDHRVNQ
jgi:hypothetical protein